MPICVSQNQFGLMKEKNNIRQTAESHNVFNAGPSADIVDLEMDLGAKGLVH